MSQLLTYCRMSGETLRDGEGGQEPDGQRSVRGVLHRPAQVDRHAGGVPLRHQAGARPHVRRVRPGHQGVERHRAGAHGEGGRISTLGYMVLSIDYCTEVDFLLPL